MAQFSLQGKTAYVTGGNGLIGRAICKTLAELGATTVSLDVVGNRDSGIIHRPFDITDSKGLETAISALFRDCGTADIWVNCAYPRPEGYYSADPDHITPDAWRKAVELLLDSYCLCSATVARQMADAAHPGSIVNLSSIYGHVGPDFSLYDGTKITPTPPPYAAIKAGIQGHSRYLACQYGPRGIRVNTVSPGGVEDNQDKTFRERYCAGTPLRRMASPDDVAGAVAFLASDAAAYVTGIDLPVDGGRLAQ
ncbi:SDR family oxidoreductase [Aestuariispira ectoiniformans]|uniref:SDR family oxidoreductase n=1 Tax=Aestuariispira ectoiniformans TaxID=2775080 RepID=UPI00223ADCC7|nr:SDR family oxidoreductase [Aestuariispira ectoiniformans]